jgi:hypothetical protein
MCIGSIEVIFFTKAGVLNPFLMVIWLCDEPLFIFHQSKSAKIKHAEWCN